MTRIKQFAISFIGKSNSGKTTLIASVITELKNRGISVSAVKHSGKGIDVDKEGKDSWKFKQAGANGVIVFSDKTLCHIEDIKKEVTAGDLMDMFIESADIIIFESFKRSELPALLVIGNHNKVEWEPYLQFKNIIAIISDYDIDTDKPKFKRDEIKNITDFIENLRKKS